MSTQPHDPTTKPTYDYEAYHNVETRMMSELDANEAQNELSQAALKYGSIQVRG